MKSRVVCVIQGILLLCAALGPAQAPSSSGIKPGATTQARIELADRLYDAGAYGQALKLYASVSDGVDGEAATETDRKKIALMHFRYGCCLMKKIGRRAPDFDKAIAEFRKAIGLNPGVGAYYSSLAEAFEQKGDLFVAERTYVKSLSLKPDDASSSRHLGIVLLKEGRSLEALARAEKTLALRPDDPDLMMDIARCQAALKNKEQATEWIVKAVLAGYKTPPGAWALDPYFLSVFKSGEMDKLFERKS